MASKGNQAAKFKGIYGSMNRTENKLAEKFFSKKGKVDKKTIKALGNKVEDAKITNKHNRQKH